MKSEQNRNNFNGSADKTAQILVFTCGKDNARSIGGMTKSIQQLRDFSKD